VSLSQKTLAVLVLRGQPLETTPAHTSLSQVHEALAVQCFDNGGTSWSELPRHWRIVSDQTNPGVAPRYVQAARIAKECGFPFLLLLDQDFHAPKDWWELYQEAVREHPSASAWAPTLLCQGRQLSPFRLVSARPGLPASLNEPLSLKQHVALNSGLLVRTELVLAAERSLRDCPLDFSDFALCHEMGLRNGWLAPVALHLEHSSSTHLGSSQTNRLARFRWFAYGARGWLQLKSKHRFSIAWWVLGRGLKLSLQYRTTSFLTAILKNFIQGQFPESVL
jgi:rhamnosyltransferase